MYRRSVFLWFLLFLHAGLNLFRVIRNVLRIINESHTRVTLRTIGTHTALATLTFTGVTDFAETLRFLLFSLSPSSFLLLHLHLLFFLLHFFPNLPLLLFFFFYFLLLVLLLRQLSSW